MPITGQTRKRRAFTGKIPSREELIEKTKERLLRHGLPRLEMSILVALTGAAGFLSSYTLLQLGMNSMAVRYPIAVAIAYGVFLLLLRVWLYIQRHGWTEVIDSGDLVDVAGAALDGAGETAEAFSGGGGSFGGGGASADFDEPVSLGLSPRPPTPAAVPKGGGGKGSGFDLGLDLDEGGFLVLLAVLILAIAALGAALWVVWTAPALLAEVLVDGLVMTGLYRRLKRTEETSYWLLSAVRRTWIPAVVAAVLFSIAGGLLQRAVPEARSLGAAWKAVTVGESERRP